MLKKSLISAALMGGTFAFISPVLFADVPIVESKADHIATSENAVPLNRQQEVASADAALIESLLFQVQELQQLVSEQRGLMEELAYQVQVLQQEQKERYVDLDKRIMHLQDEMASRPVGVVPVAGGEAEALTDEEILAEYNAATALMQEKKFDEAIAKLAIFTKKHPEHPLTPNAWYWIGEIYLLQRSTDNARNAFERIVSDYSGHTKVPDSLYKLGVIAQQAAQSDLAQAYFNRVLKDYPNSQSAKLAKARLNSN